MTTLVTGLFADSAKANHAIAALEGRGYSRDAITVLRSKETAERLLPSEQHGTKAAEGAGIGAGVGGTAGAIGAAVAAIGTALLFPGIGLLVAGPLAAALAGAGAGGALGGLVGALVGAGIPKARAELYEKGLREGGTVLGVHALNDDEVKHIETIFDKYDAAKVRSLERSDRRGAGFSLGRHHRSSHPGHVSGGPRGVLCGCGARWSATPSDERAAFCSLPPAPTEVPQTRRMRSSAR